METTLNNIKKQDRFLIKYKDKYINIKPSQLNFCMVETARSAKNYTKKSGLKLIENLIKNNVLADENIENYKFVKRSTEMYGGE